MAIIRQGTFGAENHSVARLDMFGTGENPPVISPLARTGERSYRHTGSAFGRTFIAAALRSSCAIRHGGVQRLGRLPIVTIGVGYTPLSVVWIPEVGEIKLMAGFEEDSKLYRYPIAAASDTLFAPSPTTWKIASIVAKIAASNGFVSFYLEGRKLLTWTGDTRIFAPETTNPLSVITGVYWFGNEENVTFTDVYYPLGIWGENSLIDDLTIDTLTDADIVDTRPPYHALLWTTAATDGSSTQWTKVGAATNALAVSENPPDDAVSYVATATDGKIDMYVPAVLDLTGYLPQAVTVVARGKRASLEAAENQVNLITKIATDEALATAQYMLGDWTEIEHTFWTKPGSGTWDASAVEAMQIGIKSVIA